MEIVRVNQVVSWSCVCNIELLCNAVTLVALALRPVEKMNWPRGPRKSESSAPSSICKRICSAFPTSSSYRFIETTVCCQSSQIHMSNEAHSLSLHESMTAVSSVLRDAQDFLTPGLMKNCHFGNPLSLYIDAMSAFTPTDQ